jgi:hypothetical protein
MNERTAEPNTSEPNLNFLETMTTKAIDGLTGSICILIGASTALFFLTEGTQHLAPAGGLEKERVPLLLPSKIIKEAVTFRNKFFRYTRPSSSFSTDLSRAFFMGRSELYW